MFLYIYIILCFCYISLILPIYQTNAALLTNCECGITNNDSINNRIVGGQTTSPHLFPWLVYVAKKGQLHCGGALISNKYVITAGHCVKWYRYNKTEFTVVLGRHDRVSDAGTVAFVKDIKVHEDFTSDKLHDTNDIALLKLYKAVKFTATILPVCLPNPSPSFEASRGAMVFQPTTQYS